MRSELTQIDKEIKQLKDGITKAQSQLASLNRETLECRKADLQGKLNQITHRFAEGESTQDEAKIIEQELRTITSALQGQEGLIAACRKQISSHENSITELEKKRVIAEKHFLDEFQADRISQWQAAHLAEVREMFAFNSVRGGLAYSEFLIRVLLPLGGFDELKPFQTEARKLIESLLSGR